MNPGGYGDEWGYDLLNRPVSYRDQALHVTSFSYDDRERHRERQDALGYRWTTLFDERENPIAEIDPLNHRHTTLYDAYGREWAQQDPLDHRHTTVYDALWRVWSRIDPAGGRWTTNYDVDGRVWSEQDPLDRRTSTIYDERGRVRGRMDAAGAVRTYHWDAAGNMDWEQGPRGYVTSHFYDSRGLRIATEDPHGYRTSTLYDSRGLAYEQHDQLGYVSTTLYDALSRAYARVDALGYRNTTLFDPAGRAVESIDAVNRRTTSVYDAVAQEVGRIWPDGMRTSSVYDEVGNAVAQLNGLGYRTSTLYDELDRESARIDPLNRRWSSSYDPAGRLTLRVDPKNQPTTLLYDSRDAEVGRISIDGARSSFAYDLAGQQVKAENALGVWSRTYDRVGRLESELGPGCPNAWPFTSVYDPEGNRTALLTGRGRFTFGYDALNRVTSAWDPGYGATPSDRTTWAYDGRGSIIEQRNANGTTTTSAYDALARASQIRHATGSGEEIDHCHYAYDPVGNVFSKDTSQGRTSYAYDLLDQLVMEDRPGFGRTTWAYDAGLRRISEVSALGRTTAAYDAADQLLTEQFTQAGGVGQEYGTVGAYPFLYSHPQWRGRRLPHPVNAVTSFSWDANGNLVSKQTPSARTTYSWSPGDELKEVRLAGGGVLTNTYRPDGLRHSRHDSHGRQTLVWDGSDVRAVEGADPQLFVQGADFARALGPEINRVYHTDALGTVEAVTEADQSVETRYLLNAWGETTGGYATGNPYAYHGGLGYWSEPEAGLDYVRARWLDPATARWLSIDPVSGEPRYSYARNNPNRYVDADGTQAINPFYNPVTGQTHYPSSDPFGIQALARWAENQVNRFKEQTEAVWRDAAYDQYRQAVELNRRAGFNATGAVAAFIRAVSPTTGLFLPDEGAVRAIKALLGSRLQHLAPYSTDDPRCILYGAGMLWAVIDFLVSLFLPVDLVVQVLKLISYLSNNPPIFDDLVRNVNGAYQQFLLLFQARPMSAYNRGKTLGIILTSVIGLLLMLSPVLFKAGGTLARAATNLGLDVAAIGRGLRTGLERQRGIPVMTPAPQAALPGGGHLPMGPPGLNIGKKAGTVADAVREELAARRLAAQMEGKAKEKLPKEGETPVEPAPDPGPYSGHLLKVNKPDPKADKLAKKLGGVSSVKFENDPLRREFDAVTDQYIAQTNEGSQTIKPRFRNAAKATFEASIATGRTPYFHFEKAPGADLIRKLNEYAARYNIKPLIDISPFDE